MQMNAYTMVSCLKMQAPEGFVLLKLYDTLERALNQNYWETVGNLTRIWGFARDCVEITCVQCGGHQSLVQSRTVSYRLVLFGRSSTNEGSSLHNAKVG